MMEEEGSASYDLMLPEQAKNTNVEANTWM